MILFESKRLAVRHLTPEDLEDYFRLNGDEELMRYIRPPKTREETEKFLLENIAAYDKDTIDWRLALVDRTDGHFVGSFAIIPLSGREELQVGYALLKEHWGKGYATEILQAGLKYIYEKLKLEMIAAVTEVENLASQQVLLRLKFVEEEKYEEQGKTLLRFRHSVLQVGY